MEPEKLAFARLVQWLELLFGIQQRQVRFLQRAPLSV